MIGIIHSIVIELQLLSEQVLQSLISKLPTDQKTDSRLGLKSIEINTCSKLRSRIDLDLNIPD